MGQSVFGLDGFSDYFLPFYLQHLEQSGINKDSSVEEIMDGIFDAIENGEPVDEKGEVSMKAVLDDLLDEISQDRPSLVFIDTPEIDITKERFGDIFDAVAFQSCETIIPFQDRVEDRGELVRHINIFLESFGVLEKRQVLHTGAIRGAFTDKVAEYGKGNGG